MSKQQIMIRKIDDSLRWWVGRRKPINEFEHLKNEIIEKLELWRKADDITVIRDKDSWQDNNNYARYTIYINGQNYIFPEALKKIKGYDIWCISCGAVGIEISCHSDRHSRERLT